jgi:hypothetical protein
MRNSRAPYGAYSGVASSAARGHLLSLKRGFEVPDVQDERMEAGQHEVAAAEKDDARRSYCACAS